MSKDLFNNLHIYREKRKKDMILYSKVLVTYNYEEEAAKLFYKWLQEHPEENTDDIHFRIDTVEEEEDRYGHFGGTHHYIKIYKEVEETDEEFNSRIHGLEKKARDLYEEHLSNLTHEFLLLIMPGLPKEDQAKRQKELAEEYADKLKKQILEY